VDSACANLAGTFSNAFVNAGEGNSWICKNKDHGMCIHRLIILIVSDIDSRMMSAAASLGLSLLWDTDVGLSHVDRFTYSPEEHIKAGALFATGLLNTGVRTEVDAPWLYYLGTT